MIPGAHPGQQGSAQKSAWDAPMELNRLGNQAQLGGLRAGGQEVSGFAMPTAAPPELSTRRFVVRPFRPDDFDQVVAVVGANVANLVSAGMAPGDQGLPADAEAFTEWVDQIDLLATLDLRYELGCFDDGELIGGAGLWGVVRGTAQSAFAAGWVTQARARDHVGSEGFVALCRFGFDELHLHRIEAPVLPENEAVAGVFRRLALRDAGIEPAYLQVNGTWRDHRRFVITWDDWVARRSALLDEWGPR